MKQTERNSELKYVTMPALYALLAKYLGLDEAAINALGVEISTLSEVEPTDIALVVVVYVIARTVKKWRDAGTKFEDYNGPDPETQIAPR